MSGTVLFTVWLAKEQVPRKIIFFCLELPTQCSQHCLRLFDWQVLFGDDSEHLLEAGRFQNQKFCELEVMTLHGCCPMQVVYMSLSAAFVSEKLLYQIQYSVFVDMDALKELKVYVAMTPEMASALATHGSVAPKYMGRWGLRPTREEARRLGAKIEYAVVDCFFSTLIAWFFSTDGSKAIQRSLDSDGTDYETYERLVDVRTLESYPVKFSPIGYLTLMVPSMEMLF